MIKSALSKNKFVILTIFYIRTILLNFFLSSKKTTLFLFFLNNRLFSKLKSNYFNLSFNGSNEKKKRSIVFVGESYYCFFYLAKALRKRGWDAISVSLTAENRGPTFLSHGSDLALFSKDSATHQKKIESFISEVRRKYNMIHFYSNLMLWDNYLNHTIPLDIISLKQNGVKIGYTPSGCKDYSTQSDFYQYSNKLCDKCIWQDNSKECSNKRNFQNINKFNQIADFISYEVDCSIGVQGDLNSTPSIYTEPLLYALDPKHWDPDIKIPNDFKINKKSKKHLIILTSFANQNLRTNNQKDIKGIRAMKSAIDQLISEGYPIQHVHTQDIDSINLRYIQVQADIIIDQLNYGRYGAFAREGMMLSKPVICKIDYLMPSLKNEALKECPLINASEETIYSVLKELIMLPPEERLKIGRKSREYMMKWHSADQCAERFEKIYDQLMEKK